MERLAEERRRDREIRAQQEAAAVRIQAQVRGKITRDALAYSARLACDLQQKIPIGSSEPKSAGAEAKQAMYLRSRAREVPLPAQLAAIHRGFRYMEAGSSFNTGRSDVEALWLLSEGADDLCQIAAERPATRERLKNLATAPQHHRRGFHTEAPDPMVFGPPRSPRPPNSTRRRAGARTPKLERAIKAVNDSQTEVQDQEQPMAATTDSFDSRNSVSNMR